MTFPNIFLETSDKTTGYFGDPKTVDTLPNGKWSKFNLTIVA